MENTPRNKVDIGRVFLLEKPPSSLPNDSFDNADATRPSIQLCSFKQFLRTNLKRAYAVLRFLLRPIAIKLRHFIMADVRQDISAQLGILTEEVLRLRLQVNHEAIFARLSRIEEKLSSQAILSKTSHET